MVARGAFVAALVVANSGEVMATAFAIVAGVREIDARRGRDGWQRAERQSARIMALIAAGAIQVPGEIEDANVFIVN